MPNNTEVVVPERLAEGAIHLLFETDTGLRATDLADVIRDLDKAHRKLTGHHLQVSSVYRGTLHVWLEAFVQFAGAATAAYKFIKLLQKVFDEKTAVARDHFDPSILKAAKTLAKVARKSKTLIEVESKDGTSEAKLKITPLDLERVEEIEKLNRAPREALPKISDFSERVLKLAPRDPNVLIFIEALKALAAANDNKLLGEALAFFIKNGREDLAALVREAIHDLARQSAQKRQNQNASPVQIGHSGKEGDGED